MDRGFLTKTNLNHVIVPSVRGCGETIHTQCDIPVESNLTTVDFLSEPGITTLDQTNSYGRGDKPIRTDPASSGVEGDTEDYYLDVFTTSCSMGDHSKRAGVKDDNGNIHTDYTRIGDPTVCSNQGECGAVNGWTGLLGVSNECSYEWTAPCNARISNTTQGNCEIVRYNTPPGYVSVEGHGHQICKLNDIHRYTDQESDTNATLVGQVDGDMLACSYNYRKYWDDPHWLMPGERYDPNGTWSDHRDLFNSNNIPKDRMECCIGRKENGGSVDYKKCPVDTTKFIWDNQGTHPECETDTSCDAATPQTNVHPDKMRAYVNTSVMCNGGSSDEVSLVDNELIKTPQYWCGGFLNTGETLLENLDIYSFERLYNLLDDELCNKWTDNDIKLDGGDGGNTRNKALANDLAPFYASISSILADKEKSESPIFEKYTHRYDMLSPEDMAGGIYDTTTSEDTKNTHFKFPILEQFRLSNDKQTQYLRLINILSHPRTEKFLQNVDADPTSSSTDNWHVFNNNMKVFCNRDDIFDFINYGDHHSFDHIEYNKKLADKYEHLCACYWDAGPNGVEHNPAKAQSSIVRHFSGLFPPDSPDNGIMAEFLTNINPLVAGDVPNECWENRCVGLYQNYETGDHETDETDETDETGGYSNLMNPYRWATGPHPPEGHFPVCPSICNSVCVAKASVIINTNSDSPPDSTMFNINNHARTNCSNSCKDRADKPLPEGEQRAVNQNTCNSIQSTTDPDIDCSQINDPDFSMTSPSPGPQIDDPDFSMPSPGPQSDSDILPPIPNFRNIVNHPSPNVRVNTNNNVNPQLSNEIKIIVHLVSFVATILMLYFLDPMSEDDELIVNITIVFIVQLSVTLIFILFF